MIQHAVIAATVEAEFNGHSWILGSSDRDGSIV